MKIQELIDDLAAPDEVTWRPAWESFKELGGAGVPALLAELLDEKSPLKWSRSALLLILLGDEAFCAVRDAVAADLAEEPARRARWTFGGFGSEHRDRFVEALGHASPEVRACAALGLQRMGAEALPVADALIGLLGDPAPDVRQRAVWALEEIGPGVLDALREVRRTGPGGLRRAAFRAITGIGDISALSSKDQALWQRYIRAKALADHPQDIWENSCLAVPGGDQQAILEVLEFSGARPMFFDLGLAIANGSWRTLEPPAEHPDRAEAFITPEIGGWTLIVSGWCYPAWDPEWYTRTREALLRLSVRFGTAWGFAGRGYMGTAAWACAKDGDLVWEREVTDDDEWGEIDSSEGIDTDERPGIDPTLLSSQTSMRGSGLCAVTPYGRDARSAGPAAG